MSHSITTTSADSAPFGLGKKEGVQFFRKPTRLGPPTATSITVRIRLHLHFRLVKTIVGVLRLLAQLSNLEVFFKGVKFCATTRSRLDSVFVVYVLFEGQLGFWRGLTKSSWRLVFVFDGLVGDVLFHPSW